MQITISKLHKEINEFSELRVIDEDACLEIVKLLQHNGAYVHRIHLLGLQKGFKVFKLDFIYVNKPYQIILNQKNLRKMVVMPLINNSILYPDPDHHKIIHVSHQTYVIRINSNITIDFAKIHYKLIPL